VQPYVYTTVEGAQTPHICMTWMWDAVRKVLQDLNHCEVAWFAHLHHLDFQPTLPNLGKHLAWCDDFTQIIMLIAVRPLYRVFPSDGGSPPSLSGVLTTDVGSPPPLSGVFPSDGGSPPPLPSRMQSLCSKLDFESSSVISRGLTGSAGGLP
jgi:hypothetical protein